MFRFWGARPRLLVPDNLRSGVHKASFYDPEINRSYGAMAAHYGRGQRIAAHARRYGGPRHGTLPDHMPSAHRLYAEWNPERFQSQARAIGPNTEALIIAVLARRPHPEQGFRTCLGILRLYRGIACSQSGRRDTGRREAAPKPRAGSRGAEKTNVLAGGVRQCNARPAAVPLRGRRRTRAFRRRM